MEQSLIVMKILHLRSALCYAINVILRTVTYYFEDSYGDCLFFLLRYSKTGGKQMWKMVIAVLVLLLLAILALVIYFSEK